MTTFQKAGLHLDLRIQVPLMSALRRMARRVAAAGHNVLLIEWEASFPFSKHGIISGPHAYTRREMESLVRECDGLGLEVIPVQQCFGHIEYILRHPRYAHLRESDRDLEQLCPAKADAALTEFSGIFREIAALHTSPLIHIGGDETRLLGHCETCRQRAANGGVSALYVSYLKRAAAEVIKLGKRPMLWIDMLLKHPEAAAQMPRECVFVDWNYGWPPEHFGKFSNLDNLPFEFWGAGAMRAQYDNHSEHSWRGHFENIRDYIPEARRRGFTGMVWTSWSKSGSGTFELEDTGRPQRFFPLRRRMPHAGLPLYVAAFTEAVNQTAPLDYEDFVKRYAAKQFGFTPAEARAFFKVLMLSDYAKPNEVPLKEAHRRAQSATRLMAGLTPRRHVLEFARYALMLDFTESHRRFRLLEQEAQTLDFSKHPRRRGLARKIKALRTSTDAHSRRFRNAYKGELHPDEIREEIAYRIGNLFDLENRINRRFP